MTKRIELFLPFLPGRALNSNARVHWAERADAEAELRSATNVAASADEAVKALGGWKFPVARVSVMWCMANRRPSVTECPRCLQWAIEHQRSNRQECRCYRPRDAWNAAFALKGMVDGMTDAGLWNDDTFEQVQVGAVIKRTVQSLDDEGLFVRIEEIEVPV